MNCYNCGVILNRKNRSVEHIINASIGGFKKGYNLLCQECNKEFGRTIDKELGKQLGVFGRLLNIQLDRGVHSENTSIDKVKLDGVNYHRAVVKMCLNYYLSKGYPKQYCEQVKAFVRGDHVEQVHHYYLPSSASDEDPSVSHIIHLHGNKEIGALYAYIELFNMQNMIVIFSMEYTGADIHVTYCYDVLQNKELSKNISIPLLRHELEEMQQAPLGTGPAIRYERLMGIIEKMP